jgi:peptide/nickel transport system ATP-binding protein
MAVIEVENLSIVLGEEDAAQLVLDSVSFSVEAGQIYGLVGESGSGKSTILRCIAGLYSHWTGRIAINGRELDQHLTKERCRQTQMVFQDPYGSLHPKQTVNTQLLEPIRIHKLSDADTRIDRVLEQVGLGPDFRFRYPHQLSGGQRQRVAIARALIMEPPVLLLDEPTSALDVSVQAEILNLLDTLQAEANLTYILVSHDLAVIGHMCSRFAVMQGGKIVDTLSAAALHDGVTPTSAYTGLLIESSRHYDRALAEKIGTSRTADL